MGGTPKSSSFIGFSITIQLLGYPHLWRPPKIARFWGRNVSAKLQITMQDRHSSIVQKTPKLVQLLSSTATLAGDPDAKLSVAAAFSCNAPSLHQTNTQ